MMAGLASCPPTPVGGTWLQQKKQCKRRHSMANLGTRAVTPINILGSSRLHRGNWVKCG